MVAQGPVVLFKEKKKKSCYGTIYNKNKRMEILEVVKMPSTKAWAIWMGSGEETGCTLTKEGPHGCFQVQCVISAQGYPASHS